ncbi:MAG TPA: hypothetical protein VFE22_07540 [Edaphobacter sp.]|nr:hypothetical protein [Edaphobacter sp.]
MAVEEEERNRRLEDSLEDLRSSDHERQDRAFHFFIEATREPVDWAYKVWAELMELLGDGDNRQRAIAAQVLCNLAKSDPKNRMRKDLVALLEVTRDARFVTARHAMQSLWKVGVAGESQRKALVEGLTGRFKECVSEKNCTLIRYDILESLRRIYDTVRDEEVRTTALALIALEQDQKYRKKYLTLWRDKA